MIGGINMLSPDYIRDMPTDVLIMYGKLEEDIIRDISRRINKGMKLTASADYQISALQGMGYNLKDIKKEIAKTTKIAEKEVGKMLKESSFINYENDKMLYGLGGKKLPEMPSHMVKYINATVKQTNGSLKNITKTLGFVDKSNKFKDLSTFYKDTLDASVYKMGTGAFDYDTVVKGAVKTMADSGIKSIDYASGRKYTLESAVRMTIRTATSQLAGRISEDNADTMGQDLMEISAHSGARPDHAEWQGQLVSRSGENNKYLSADDIGYGSSTGFKGANCRHDWFAYFEGISKKAYTEKQLKNIDPPGFKYDGKKYTHYEATQKQRHIERQMSGTKRKLIAYDGAGLKKDFTAESIKLKRQRVEYERFSKKAKIRPKNERHGVYMFDRSISSKAVWAGKRG